jgi:hypothetical protein
MSVQLAYESIPYDEVSALFLLSSLPSDAVVRDADAEKLIEATPAEEIVAVAPVSMATGYLLAQEPPTAVKLSHVSGVETLPGSIEDYEVLVRGHP